MVVRGPGRAGRWHHASVFGHLTAKPKVPVRLFRPNALGDMSPIDVGANTERLLASYPWPVKLCCSTEIDTTEPTSSALERLGLDESNFI